MTQNLSSTAFVKPAVKDAQAEVNIPASYGKTESFLLPKDPDDGKNVIVEIRGGVGRFYQGFFRLFQQL